ncbi:MAG: hypothetical protein HY721_04350, partial [Planctomycetes bacterium]|nr:hypothetical protein [Planctomycetota bacterium]
MSLRRTTLKSSCSLGARIGGGGEGNVHLVRGHPELVAKVYHEPKGTPVEKLRLMLANPPVDPMASEGHHSIAWPIDLLEDGRQAVVGYLMPRLRDMLPIHQVYNLRDRLKSCPGFSYKYLYAAAANIASSVAALHAKGYVIGDVSHANMLVNRNALTSFVDVDSFQVYDPAARKWLRCRVITPEFTCPELQGRDIAALDRTVEHDLFGLGVLIYLLLMEGFHPYKSKFLAAGEPPPLEEKIRLGGYPHAPTGNGTYGPPPGAVPFVVLPEQVRELFTGCFAEGHSQPWRRPQAHEWRRVLRDVLGGFRSCAANSQHQFPSHLGACPWCARAALLGQDPFPAKPAPRPRPGTARPPPAPQRPPVPPPAAAPVPAPVPVPVPVRGTRPRRRGLGFLVAGLAALVVGAWFFGYRGGGGLEQALPPVVKPASREIKAAKEAVVATSTDPSASSEAAEAVPAAEARRPSA